MKRQMNISVTMQHVRVICTPTSHDFVHSVSRCLSLSPGLWPYLCLSMIWLCQVPTVFAFQEFFIIIIVAGEFFFLLLFFNESARAHEHFICDAAGQMNGTRYSARNYPALLLLMLL